MPTKQEPGSTSVTSVREVTSMRLSTRFQYCLISLTSQCALLASRKASQATTLARIAMRLEHQHRDLEFVDAQMKDRVVEFARDLQRPERCALRDHAVDIGGRRRLRRLDRNGARCARRDRYRR